jgi:hypothetical protein
MRAYLADLAPKSAKIGTLGLTEPQFSFRQIAMLYGTALAAFAVALGVRLALATPLGDESPYLFFVPAVRRGRHRGARSGSIRLATFVVWRSHDISAA